MKKLTALLAIVALFATVNVEAQTVTDMLNRQFAAMELSMAGQTPAPINLPTNIPQATSYSNTTALLDAGTLTLGAGQTMSLQSYLRFSYNFNIHFGAGVQGDFGSANDLNAAGLIVYARKVFGDNAEGYAGPLVKYSWAARGVLGGLEAGFRYVPFNNAAPQLAVHGYFDALFGGGSGQNGRPSTGIGAGASWRF